ncbi:MAG: hypothetical protein JWP57_4425 [Spirosoma sp.]|nr:hypothetical protein [Spirosoma sp.]
MAAKLPVGRPQKAFTAKQREQAEALSGLGLPHRQIATILGCSEPTLRKHLEAELKSGEAKATARVAQTLFNKAVKGDTASMIFWMKVRAGWKETSTVEHSGPDGGPIETVAMVDRPPRETREDWVARRQRELDAARLLLAPAAGVAD